VETAPAPTGAVVFRKTEMSQHPHTIENGDGEELTFLGIRSDE
jgi:hypothetical protein